MSKIDRVVLEITELQNELNELLEDSSNRNTEKVIEKSQDLDKLILFFYDLKRGEKCKEEY